MFLCQIPSPNKVWVILNGLGTFVYNDMEDRSFTEVAVTPLFGLSTVQQLLEYHRHKLAHCDEKSRFFLTMYI